MFLRSHACDAILDERFNGDTGFDAHVADALFKGDGVAARVTLELLNPLLVGPLRRTLVLRVVARLLTRRVFVD